MQDLGRSIDSLTKDFALELVQFLNEIHSEEVLQLVIDNWDTLVTIPNPGYEAELKGYNENPYAQLSPFDIWQIGAAHGSHALQPLPAGEDIYKSPEPPSKFFKFPDSQWKEFILSLTSANIQNIIDSLRIERKTKS